jgi:hypothetical protein
VPEFFKQVKGGLRRQVHGSASPVRL